MPAPTQSTGQSYTGTITSLTPAAFSSSYCTWLVTFTARITLNVTFAGSNVSGTGSADEALSAR